MIKTICFDLDGVYFSPIGKKKFNDFLQTRFSLYDDRLKSFHNSSEMSKLSHGKISEQEFYDFFRGYVQSNITNSEIKDAWVAGYEIDREVQKVLQNLKAQNYKICACTNNNSIRLNALREKFPEFVEDFDFVVSSHEVGECKPKKEIFEALIQKSEGQADEILYSDDNPDRLSGANELGIQTFQFHDFTQFCKELKDRGVPIDLTELNEIKLV
jgi:putative hydrolase of the HAD superfamily